MEINSIALFRHIQERYTVPSDRNRPCYRLLERERLRLKRSIELYEDIYSSPDTRVVFKGNFELINQIKLLNPYFNWHNYRQLILFSELFLLHSMCICILVSNAEAERVFSTLNRVKSKDRCLLRQDTLEALIRISHSMVSRGDINFLNATHQFFAMKDRRLR